VSLFRGDGGLQHGKKRDIGRANEKERNRELNKRRKRERKSERERKRNNILF
jgi:hypothetical protein